MNWGSVHKSSRMRILVLGYLIRGPIGGMAWHHLQYVLGLKRLGHEVWYLEDSGDTEYCCYDPSKGLTHTDPGYGLQFASTVFQRLDLGNCWAYYDRHQDRWHGPLSGRIPDVLSSADLLLNLSCSNVIRPWLEEIPLRVLVDTDPVFTQVRNLTDPARMARSRQHNVFFTFGENIGRPDCRIPGDGFPWQPTRQPVVPDVWPNTPGHTDGKFTTVMQWESYPGLEFKGRYFGLKSDSFQDYFDLPQKTTQPLELAIGSPNAPLKRLRENGWGVVNPLKVTRTPWSYQTYIQESKAEFSIAKQAYVAGHTGWFSERSAAYLACGRPVVVEDSGFSSWLVTGGGVLSFKNPEEALAAIEQLCGNYAQHCRQAREIMHTYFDSSVILSKLLESAMVSPPLSNTHRITKNTNPAV